jgi:hypothetical protein
MGDQETEKTTKLKSASMSKLPMASVISDKDTFEMAVDLLKQGADLKAQIELLEVRKKAISEEMAAICGAFDLPGFKHGRDGFEYHGYTTRKSLSKEKLLALGVSADVIAGAYVDSTPFLNVKLVHFDLD